MLIVLVSLFASLVVIPYLAYKYDRDCLPGWVIIPNIIVAAGSVVIMLSSYNSYIDMKQRFVNFNTHADTIASYEKFAKLDTTEPGAVGPITDLKYQNYQRGVKDLIEDLRNSCIVYNQTLVGKRTRGNNIVFSWLIVMPDDDMEAIKFSDFLDVRNRETI